ncbi:MAG: hypothetical protein GXP27_13235 [Planctomycetes bacterium]|nr:hypothetical protein [Planctomycetota bacterium]
MMTRAKALSAGWVAWLLAALVLFSALSVANAAGRFDDLLYRVPRSANALLVIDVKGVHSSPLAVKEGWKSQHEASYVKKPMLLPPESDRMILASQMNPNRDFEVLWEGAVVSLTEPLPPRAIARAEGGYVDQIGGVPAVWSPSDAYIVLFEPKLMGILSPAHRQAVARWIEDGEVTRTVVVSKYLKEAADSVDGQKTQIVLALDLKDAVQPHRLEQALNKSQLVGDDAAKKQKWAKIVSSIRGVTLSVQIGRTAQGTLRVDFSESTSPFGKDAKALVLGVLDEYGVGIDELQQWKTRLDGESIVMQGELSTPGMRRIFSLLELPTTNFTAADELPQESPGSSSPSSRTSEDKEKAVVEASQTYFKSVSTLLNDLQEEFRTNRDARRSLSAVFLERYAKRIDRLPILHVDEELLAYGMKVAETLRSTSIASRQAGVRAGVRKAQGAGYYGYRGYGYSYGARYGTSYNDYYTARTRSSEKTQIRREEDAKARQVRFQNWKEIQDATAAIRAKMTKKYKVPF